MKRGSIYFTIAFSVILIILIIGYALYVYPKNYELLEIDAKNENYSIVGLAIAYFAIFLSLFFFIVSIIKRGKLRIFFLIELIMSIALLLLWRRY